MSEQSDTPRTNGVWIGLPNGSESALHELKSFARTLERELAAANDRIAEIEKVLELCNTQLGVVAVHGLDKLGVTAATLMAYIARRNHEFKELQSTQARVAELEKEVKEYRERLLKEHLPAEYKTWEQVWNNQVAIIKERDAALAKVKELEQQVATGYTVAAVALLKSENHSIRAELALANDCVEALRECYDVREYPADGTSSQEKALASYDDFKAKQKGKE